MNVAKLNNQHTSKGKRLLLLDRFEGKPKQTIGFTDNEINDMMPINIMMRAA